MGGLLCFDHNLVYLHASVPCFAHPFSWLLVLCSSSSSCCILFIMLNLGIMSFWWSIFFDSAPEFDIDFLHGSLYHSWYSVNGFLVPFGVPSASSTSSSKKSSCPNFRLRDSLCSCWSSSVVHLTHADQWLFDPAFVGGSLLFSCTCSLALVALQILCAWFILLMGTSSGLVVGTHIVLVCLCLLPPSLA